MLLNVVEYQTQVRVLRSAYQMPRVITGEGELLFGHFPHRIGDIDYSFVNAWSRSAMMSFGSSRPTDRRIRPSSMPALSRSSWVMCSWVMVRGCMQIVRLVPKVTAWMISLKLSITVRTAGMPPGTTKDSMPPPAFIWLLGQVILRDGCSGPGS